MTEALFPPTPAERLARIALFISEERRHRIRMIERHPDQEGYWGKRVVQADEALDDLAAIAEVVGT